MDQDKLFDTWDSVRSAICKVECALPFQMTEAMAELIEARKAMDAEIRACFLPKKDA